ncbi:unnamed protein product [Leuciscus chuanchicus]
MSQVQTVTWLKDVMPNKTGWEQPFSEEKGIQVWTSNSYVNSTLIPPLCADPTLHIPLPPEVLRHILLDVVYEEGDKAFHTLSLVCRKFNEIINHPGIVDWKSVSPDVRKEYRVEFKLTNCDACGFLYKNTTGYCGNGKKGVFTAFCSDKEFDGFCSMDCYYMGQHRLALTCTWERAHVCAFTLLCAPFAEKVYSVTPRVFPVHTCLTVHTAAEGRHVAERGWSDTVLSCGVPGMDRSDAANEFMRATEPFSAYFSTGN